MLTRTVFESKFQHWNVLEMVICKFLGKKIGLLYYQRKGPHSSLLEIE